MGKLNDKITSRVQKFIEAQKVFFVATAPKNGRINLSPKGMDSFRVLSPNRVTWLSVTGSGNETSAHLLVDNRITIMFCAFEGAPNILRLYGTAKEILPKDAEWNELISLFPKLAGTRQIFDVTVETTQNSCGMSIPFYEYKEERNELSNWADEIGQSGIKDYWNKKNKVSIDGLKTKLK
ncbi:pyridoxamine 5'-phosphate oxidase family protein [Tenacibaculum pacificus]|uniref:pyridoxamine 5'-phosphate oxidase family protein n=1 Tax=Tenacibaculum pacificus TaxID=3018314 RepID=UPI0022F37D74|nr:pyridoxamine 5'-phosphate oxidase family protein [Tenacibaculum pacificus]WBX73737.1 pyridoxamine 5'-phosphate oxidase family protein [Tenacibaculum pacificus]